MYWGAKARAFKCYGLGSVIFIDHILLDPIGNISEKVNLLESFEKMVLLFTVRFSI